MKWLFSSVFGLIGVILLLVGCPFLAVAAGTYYIVDYRTANWITVTGEVTGMSESTTTDSEGFTSDTYCPYVAFTTQAGEEIEVNANDCSNPPAYDTGDSVELKYNPDEPRDIQLKGGTAQTISLIFLWVFGGLGAVFVVVGAILGLVGLIIVLRRSG
jgi:hypothetical protein